MKRIFNIILLFLAITSFTSCKNEIIMFDETMSFVAFTTKTTSVSEVDAVLNVPIIVTAELGKPAIDVSFSIISEGHDKPAIEGTDFIVLSDSKLSFPSGCGYNIIQIQTIDNDLFTGTKTFSIVLNSNTLDYNFGALDTLVVSLLDNDHPFNWIMGDYTASGNLWQAEEALTWNMVLNPVENDINTVQILGLVGGSYGHEATDEWPVYGIINAENNSYTLTIAVGQKIDSYGFGTCSLVGSYGPDGAVEIEVGEMITCDIVNNNGAVSIYPRDEYGWYITDGELVGNNLELVVGDGSKINTVWIKK